MVGSNVANSSSFTVTTPGEQDVVFTRLFDAPVQLVFDVMSKPEHVKRWWGQLGEGYSVSVCAIDLCPVGAGYADVCTLDDLESLSPPETRIANPPS
jgi:hypothetical protein